MRLLILLVCAAGCMVSNGLQYDAISETNLYHIAKIRKGMSEKQVLQIMHKPYDYETFEVADDIYDVWFYVTKPTGLDQTRMVPQNLTPLTFKNGILVGTGYSWYYYAMKEEAAEVATQNPEPEKPNSQDVEDADFEKALKTFPEKSPPPSSPPTNPPPTKTLTSNAAVEKEKGPSQVQIGMSKAEVTNVLGSPSKQETFSVNGETYEVWFYEVPLTFKNGILVGMTADYYQGIRGGPHRLDCYGKEGERMEGDEAEQNFNFW